MTERSPTEVLVVDDESAITEMYALWLADEYAVTTATDGETALEAIGPSTDVVLLDRRMPDLSGEAVLSTIRDRDSDCRVAMVTGISPDADVIDMGFDDYLVKPVDKEELLATVRSLERRASYNRRARQLYALSAKRAALRSDGEDTPEVQQAIEDLEDRIEALNEASTSAVAEFDTTDFRAVFRDITVPGKPT